MKISLSLSQQGLILVGLPVGLMVVFLLSLFILFLKLENDASEVDHSKTILAAANSLVKQNYDAASQLIIYKHSRDQQDRDIFDKQIVSIEKSFDKLHGLLQRDPKGLELLAKLKKTADLGITFMRRYESYLSKEIQLSELEVAVLYKELDDCGKAFAAKLQKLDAHEAALHKLNSQEERQTRLSFKIWILVAAAMAVAIGAGILLVFTRSTTSRLAHLMSNTVRLSNKEPLLPRLSSKADDNSALDAITGRDEISTLDLFFHKMANELAEATRKERAILDNAVDVICSIDADGKFKAMNPASLQVWGYEPEALIGRHYSEIVQPEDRQKLADAIAQSKETNALVNIEDHVITSEKNVVDTLWSFRWSPSEQSVFCVAHDISDRKEVERLKQEFVAVISHELRTPLTSLQMTLTLLLNGNYGALSPTAEQRLKSADISISRLIMLITDLLDMEKMEAGKLSMTFRDVDLSDVIENSVESVRGFAEQQGVKVIAEEQIRQLKVLVDADRLVQVIVNLLSNAIKFSEEDGQVEVKVASIEGFSEIQVIDHGAGIPAGSEELIFAKYQQAHVSNSKRTKGTGLGLPICKAIVEQHGGTIGVRATEGGGSTFWFRIPDQASSLDVTPKDVALLLSEKSSS